MFLVAVSMVSLNKIYAVIKYHDGRLSNQYLYYNRYDAKYKFREILEHEFRENGWDKEISQDMYRHNFEECVKAEMMEDYCGFKFVLKEFDVEGTPQFKVKLPDKGYLMSSAGNDPAYPSVWLGYSEDGQAWTQDLAGIEQKQGEDALTAYIYEDEYDEDYTRKCSIKKYAEQIGENKC